MRTRSDLLNFLIAENEYETYLEIGVESGVNLRDVVATTKTSVDPDPSAHADYVMTSDEFFTHNTSSFDLVFVDGMHSAEQVESDVENALACLAPGGTVVCHDCNPTEREWQLVPRGGSVWCGDVWKAWVALRSRRDDLEMAVVDLDFGCGVIRRGHQTPIATPGELTWNDLDRNRSTWLNLVSVEEFLKRSSSPAGVARLITALSIQTRATRRDLWNERRRLHLADTKTRELRTELASSRALLSAERERVRRLRQRLTRTNPALKNTVGDGTGHAV